MVTFWKFDREQGRILPEESFALEMPPYWQDLCDAGKLVSAGWVFCNSFNTERATGGLGAVEGAAPFESGVSQNDSHFTPEHVEINQGDRVTWYVTNLERAVDAIHGFSIPAYNISLSLEPGETVTVEFVANQHGVFSYYCTEFCSVLHLEMKGYMLVKPVEETAVRE
jgi:heme/copper-type cytochrome/quinol oxidase subunit 2